MMFSRKSNTRKNFCITFNSLIFIYKTKLQTQISRFKPAKFL